MTCPSCGEVCSVVDRDEEIGKAVVSCLNCGFFGVVEE